MHLENLLPLVKVAPLFVLLALALGGYLWFERARRKRDHLRMVQREQNYWKREKAYRARMRVMEWLGRTKTLRLTYDGSPLSSRAPKTSRGK